MNWKESESVFNTCQISYKVPSLSFSFTHAHHLSLSLYFSVLCSLFHSLANLLFCSIIPLLLSHTFTLSSLIHSLALYLSCSITVFLYYLFLTLSLSNPLLLSHSVALSLSCSIMIILSHTHTFSFFLSFFLSSSLPTLQVNSLERLSFEPCPMFEVLQGA